MRRRRGGGRGGDSFPGLDSLIDTTTGIIGALVFVLVYATLSSLGARARITTPLVSTGTTTGVMFECRKRTAFYIQDVRDWAESTPEERHGSFENDYYKNVTDTSFKPRKRARGENASELKKSDSEFRRELRKLDPKTQHVFFLVRTDSFDVFHVARKVAMEEGFKVGWDPLKVDIGIGWGGGGDVNVDSHM